MSSKGSINNFILYPFFYLFQYIGYVVEKNDSFLNYERKYKVLFNPWVPDAPNWRISALEKRFRET